jgi:hypothetical protein
VAGAAGRRPQLRGQNFSVSSGRTCSRFARVGPYGQSRTFRYLLRLLGFFFGLFFGFDSRCALVASRIDVVGLADQHSLVLITQDMLLNRATIESSDSRRV